MNCRVGSDLMSRIGSDADVDGLEGEWKVAPLRKGPVLSSGLDPESERESRLAVERLSSAPRAALRRGWTCVGVRVVVVVDMLKKGRRFGLNVRKPETRKAGRVRVSLKWYTRRKASWMFEEMTH